MGSEYTYGIDENYSAAVGFGVKPDPTAEKFYIDDLWCSYDEDWNLIYFDETKNQWFPFP